MTRASITKNHRPGLAQQKLVSWSFHHGSDVTNPTSIHEDVGLIPGLAQWVKRSGLAMSCGVAQPLAWELPRAIGAALKKKKIKKKKRKEIDFPTFLEAGSLRLQSGSF